MKKKPEKAISKELLRAVKTAQVAEAAAWRAVEVAREAERNTCIAAGNAQLVAIAAASIVVKTMLRIAFNRMQELNHQDLVNLVREQIEAEALMRE